jgi:hypothetical protein
VRTPTRLIAAVEMAVILPAVLFMAALAVRDVQPLQDEPAHAAQQIVSWYSARVWTLWLLLVALPLGVLVTGCATLLHFRTRDVQPRRTARQSLALFRAPHVTLFLAATTLAAAGILVIVVLHMLAN